MKKGRFTTVLLVVIFLSGLSLLLYPSVSNYWNSLHQSGTISNYSEKVAEIEEDDYEQFLQDAVNYNSHIPERQNAFVPTERERAEYESLLNITGTGVMGYIEIPSIEVSLPIYHGTEDTILQVAVGHLDWTSLPVGGESTHCVLSGHRGLPSAKLFTHLDKLIVGDVFMIRVLDEVFTYEVDQILIVEPEETDALQIVKGKDYCTLVTCTPYGINTHRLLVRGHRIENAEEALQMHINAEVIQIEPMIVAAVIGIPILILLMFCVAIVSGIRRKYGKKL